MIQRIKQLLFILLLNQCIFAMALAPATVGGVVASAGQLSNTLKVSLFFFD